MTRPGYSHRTRQNGGMTADPLPKKAARGTVGAVWAFALVSAVLIAIFARTSADGAWLGLTFGGSVVLALGPAGMTLSGPVDPHKSHLRNAHRDISPVHHVQPSRDVLFISVSAHRPDGELMLSGHVPGAPSGVRFHQ